MRTGSGVGSAQHMVTQWFAQIAGIELEQVPYRGGGQAINDLIAGHVKLGTLGSTPLIPHYKAGKLLLLAQTTAARSQSLPDVPTFQEAGIKDLVLDQWLGVFVPAGTPPAIVARLNAEVGKALADPAIHDEPRAIPRRSRSAAAPRLSRKLMRDDFAKYRAAGEGTEYQGELSSATHGRYCGSTFAIRNNSAQRGISCAKYCLSDSGLPGNGSAIARSAKYFLVSGSARIWLSHADI